MSSNFSAIDGAVYEPDTKIIDIYRKTAAELTEFRVIPQIHYDQTLETWAQMGYSSPFYLLW